MSKTIYEVVTGQILLSHRLEFFKLHREFLLPAMQRIGIKPKVLLITEIGDYGKFLDIYEYASLAEYELKTDKLLQEKGLEIYYKEVGQCIEGSINIAIMKDLPYSNDFV